MEITSGTITLLCCDSMSFSGSGPGLAVNGSFGFVEFAPDPFAVVDHAGFAFNLNSESGLGLEINGIWGDPSIGGGYEGYAEVSAASSKAFSGAGLYPATLLFDAHMSGCAPSCVSIDAQGTAKGFLEVVQQGNVFQIDKASFAFSSVPEPSTLALTGIVLGFLAGRCIWLWGIHGRPS